jgi:hypothetical protein
LIIHLVGKIEKVQNKGRSWCRRLLLVCTFNIGVFVYLQFDIAAINFHLRHPDQLTLKLRLPNLSQVRTSYDLLILNLNNRLLYCFLILRSLVL